MAEEYGFKQKTCYCGANLAGLQVVATSNRFWALPQGKCPECGREMLLDAPPVEPVMPVKAPAKTVMPVKAPAKSKK